MVNTGSFNSQMANKLKIGIIGAGVTGMAAAWDLSQAGHEVSLFESGDSVGGLAAGFRDEGWDWSLEKFYHHWFETDKDIKQLLTEMGRWDKVLWPRPKTSYWIDGKIIRSEISPSALFLPVSLVATLRMGLAGIYLKTLRNGQKLEKYTADGWLRRYMGEEAYSKFFKPLLIGKFADQFPDVNMAWMWARIHTRSLRLGIYEGGFDAFLQAMAQSITKWGAKIHLSTPIDRIQTKDKPILIINDKQQVFDIVISTTSPQLLLKMTDGLAETDYGRKARNLKSIGALCVIFALKRSLLTDGTYWLNLPADSPDKSKSRFPYLALVEHTNWMPKEYYGEDVLVYCGDYVPPDHEYFQLSEETLAERFADTLSTFNLDFKKDWIRKYWVFGAPYAQPVPGINHSENILPLKTPLPGVYWASMSQVYPYDRGTNYAVEIGRRLANLILNERD